MEWRDSGLRLLFVIGLHIISLALLMRYGAAHSEITLAPIMVSIIAPPAPDIIEQPQQPPKPLPVRKIKEPPKKIVTAETKVPSEFVAPPPPPQETPPPPAAPPAPVVAEAPIIPPDFSADYLSNPAPEYPQMSKRLGEQGRVVLRVLVDTVGQPEQVEVEKSSGYPRLDAAARQAVEHWKFKPASQGGHVVVAAVNVPVLFSLKER